MPPSEPSTANPVYLLHGLLGTAYAHFGAQIRAWGSRHAVVPVDLPGHGRCPLDAGVEYLDEAFSYLVSVVERFGPGRLVAASYLGGPLAVRCAAQRPELVTSLVLTGFAPGLDRQAFLGLLAGFDRLAAEHPDLAAEYDRLHGSRWKDTLAAFGEHSARRFDRVLVPPAAIGALPVDTLIVNGSLKSVERTAAERASQFGSRSAGVVIDGAGHIASHDAPEAFTAAVEDFWRGGDNR
jgi:pimeloyl-ACP methyl ester carboxylesterase